MMPLQSRVALHAVTLMPVCQSHCGHNLAVDWAQMVLSFNAGCTDPADTGTGYKHEIAPRAQT